jgi:TonB-linked SusC/RagA family outer membrane protein
MKKQKSYFYFFVLTLASIFLTNFNYMYGQSGGSQITGKVIDESGEPLIGVTVIIEGQNTGVVTDLEGEYKISASSNDVLLFQYLGMESVRILVGTQYRIDVTMQSSDIELDAVVVVGYGVQQKRDVTTAISSVSSDAFQNLPVTDINQALLGQAAGVDVSNSTGLPGGGLDIRIRGLSTLGSSSNPLYVIDGVIIQTGLESESGVMSFINPGDVESIEILKDAAAASIYGSRASNGVVIITTKSGGIGKATVNATVRTGIQQVFNKVDLLSPTDFATLAIEARNNGYVSHQGGNISDPDNLRGAQFRLQKFQDFLDSGSSGTDWQNEIFRLAMFQEYQVNVSGGTRDVNYMFSGGVLDNKGIVKNTGFTRYSFRANIGANLSRNIDMGLRINPVFNEQDFLRTTERYHDANAGIIQAALLMDPTLDVYDPSSISGYTTGIQQGFGMVNIENPVAKINLLDDKRTNFRFLGDIYLNYKIIRGLDFKVSGSINTNTYFQNGIVPSTIGGYAQIAPRDNVITANSNFEMNYQSAAQLTYNKAIDKHNYTIVGVYENQFQKTRGMTARAEGTWTDKLIIVDNSLDESFRQGTSSIAEWAISSWIARFNYNYDQKYYLTSSIRADGSSRFAKRWGVFPAVSAAWRVSQENFLKDNLWISDMKLRASYGETGNNTIGNYMFLSEMRGNNYVFGAGDEVVRNGIRMSSFGNDELTWEKNHQFDLGFDLALFNNRVNLVFDVYDKQTHGLLLNLPVPSIMGQTNILSNIGRIENKGLEVTLNTRNFINKFKWNSNFNISFNRQKVLELGPEGDPIYGSSSFFQNTHITQVGQPIGLFYGLNVVGVYQNQEQVDSYPGIKSGAAISRPGEFIFEDVKQDGTIDIDDRTIIGNPNPDFTFGLRNNFSHGNLSLSVFLRGTVGFDVMNMSFGDTMYNMGANMPASAINRWQSEENPGDGKTPRVVKNLRGVLDNSQLNSSFIEDGSFLNIQNISLSYACPRKFIRKLKIENLTATLGVNNVHMFTSYTGYNPEAAMSIGSTLSPGVDWGVYPLSRNYTLTLSLKL